MRDHEPRQTEGRGRLYKSVLDTIGDTPCVRVNRIGPDGVRMYVKAEFFNPASSVKDRLAVSIVEEAERAGDLGPGQTVVEATSGNTGVGLAMVCAARGYPLVVTMPDSASIERRRMMRFLGAKVVLTPREEKGIGAYLKARELVDENGWFFAAQFETKANALIHERTTGPEIVADFRDKGLDYFVSGYGTGGTVTGIARVLRREFPKTRIVLSEPDIAQLVSSGEAQERSEDGAPASSHAAFAAHPIQGWTPDFIPLVLQEAIDESMFDEVVPVSGADGVQWAKRLASEEGIITGISGGASFAAAVDVAKRANPGSVVLCMLPDTGERYLSTPLFEDIAEDMDDEETRLSLSTPGYQM